MDDSIASLVARMEADLARMEAADDPRRHFHGTYLRTTKAIDAEINRGGFADAQWLTRWDLVFADLYLVALDGDSHGAPISRPWRIAFDVARQRDDLASVHHVLLGMNAHINYDLPQALVAVISAEEFADPAALGRRDADHQHVDHVLAARVDAEDGEYAGPRRLLDRIMAPLNRLSTKRFLAESRAKVWRNAMLLNEARNQSPARYAELLGELEALSAARLADLVAPGPVLVKLARRGFGVVLPDSR